MQGFIQDLPLEGGAWRGSTIIEWLNFLQVHAHL